jgi:hypothetical protein
MVAWRNERISAVFFIKIVVVDLFDFMDKNARDADLIGVKRSEMMPARLTGEIQQEIPKPLEISNPHRSGMATPGF